MDSDTIFWLLYSFYVASSLWDFYLTLRQYKLYRRTTARPGIVAEIISEEDFAKARAYKLDKMHFGFFSTAFNFVVMSIVFLCTMYPMIWNFCSNMAQSIWPGGGEIWHSIVFIWVCSIAETFFSLPFSYYDTFYIEQKHGFNKETVPFFFKDRALKLAISLLLSTPVVALLIWIIRNGGPNFHIYAWAAISLIIFAMTFIYPEFIAPLFDKYTPLPESELKRKIEALASKVQFPLTKLYVVEGSKRSTHSNAYMYGFWKNKRIVLYDTLLSKELNELMKQLEMDKKEGKAKKGESDRIDEEKNEEEPKKDEEEEVKKEEEEAVKQEEEEVKKEEEEAVKQEEEEVKKEEEEAVKQEEEEVKKEEEEAVKQEEEEVKKEEEEAVKQEEEEVKKEEKLKEEKPVAEKRIGMTDDEVVAVLGHELGHWKLYHSIGLLASTEINLLIMLFAFSLFYKQQELFVAFGFPASEQHILIGLTIIGQYVLAPYTELLSLMTNVITRKMEFAADRFSAQLGYAPKLCSGLIKLGKDNLTLPIDDWLYSWCNHSHPPIPERMEALKKFE